MDINRIIAAIDHTLLSPAATWGEIKALCDDGLEYGVASVCVPPSFVKDAADYVGGEVPISTVIGFPGGYSTTTAKLFEAKDAIANGADEIDMVINIGCLKDKKFGRVFSEINGVKAMIGEEHILKVIVETSLLTEEEKTRMGEMVAQSGADFISSSTGFSAHGATPEDASLFRRCSRTLKIKASGGISTLEDGWNYLMLGASRLGTGKLIPLLRELGK